MREGLIEVPGGRVFYRVAGENAGGVPLLVLHGGPGAPHDYLETLEALADERPVVFYDQLGCGASDRPGDLALYAMPRFVEELAIVRQTLGLARLHILGQSFGCMLAVDYLLAKRPEGVLSLVLSAPCLSAQRFAADQRAYLEGMPEDVRETILTAEASGDYDLPAYQEAVTAYYKEHLCLLDPRPDCLNRTFEKMGLPVYLHMWGPSEFTLTGTLRGYDRTADLARIGLPALFTCGRHDEAAPETCAYYQSLMPGSELAILEDASHMHHLERPEEYLRLARDFLRRNE